jgi:hypothetical protein
VERFYEGAESLFVRAYDAFYAGAAPPIARAAVSETLGEPIDQPDRLVRRPQQQGPGIRCTYRV